MDAYGTKKVGRMEEVRSGLLYTETHEWIQRMEDGTAVIGITDHAQHEVGDVVFVEVPEEGKVLKAGDEMGALESVKTVAPIYSPVSGKVVRSNALLGDSPETVNSSPYDDGWIAIIKLNDPGELEGMMDPASYRELISQ